MKEKYWTVLNCMLEHNYSNIYNKNIQLLRSLPEKLVSNGYFKLFVHGSCALPFIFRRQNSPWGSIKISVNTVPKILFILHSCFAHSILRNYITMPVSFIVLVPLPFVDNRKRIHNKCINEIHWTTWKFQNVLIWLWLLSLSLSVWQSKRVYSSRLRNIKHKGGSQLTHISLPKLIHLYYIFCSQLIIHSKIKPFNCT